MRSRLRRAGALVVAPLLAALTLVAWSFASPLGASPDDDFHLVSIWCAGPSSELCTDDGAGADERVVPRSLVLAPCYVADETASAVCQSERFSWDVTETVTTKRGNFANGGYPPLYYATASLLAGSDIQVSALAIRLLNVGVFLAFAVTLFWLLPTRFRAPLVIGWLVSTVPLGLFILASNNPGSWALTGVVSSAAALFGWFSTTGRRKAALGVVFALAVVIAAGARGDAAAYTGFAIAVVWLLNARRTRQFALDSILPAAMGLVALVFLLSSRQVSSGVGGFGGGSDNAVEQLGGFGLLAYNILNVPWLWAGAFGDWGLGWTFTSMPRVVPLAATAAFVAIGIAGFSVLGRRKAVAVALVVVVLWALPVYVLQAGGDAVGANVSPRYILPLVCLLALILLLPVSSRSFQLNRPTRVVTAIALIGAHFVALHIAIRRYVTGLDVGGLDLGANAEWWWDGPVGPNLVWLLGSLAYALLVVILIARVTPGSRGDTETDPRAVPERPLEPLDARP